MNPIILKFSAQVVMPHCLREQNEDATLSTSQLATMKEGIWKSTMKKSTFIFPLR